MDFSSVDFVACLVAAVAAFVFGAAWYMTLAKPWMAAIGKTEAEVKANRSPIPFLVSGLALFVMAVVLAMIWGGGLAAAGLTDVLRTSVILWVGFVLTTLAVNHAYQGQKRSLTVIDGGYWLGVLLIEGVVLWLFA
jgi:hypothetical protein